MAGSEPAPEQDEPPGATTKTSSESHESTQAATTSTEQRQSIHRQELDDFGLPIKPIQRQSITSSASSTGLEDGEGHSEEHQSEDSPRTSRFSENEVGSKMGRSQEKKYEPPVSSLENGYTIASLAADSQPTDGPQIPKKPSQALDETQCSEKLQAASTQTQSHGQIPDVSAMKVRNDVDTEALSHAKSSSIVDDLLHEGTTGGASGWSHQALAPHKPQEGNGEEEKWQDMPAFAPYDMYDDDNKLIAREARDSDDEADAYTGLGGAGKGYTKVQLDEDAQSATSMDENTEYLFKPKSTNLAADDEEEEQRDPLAQLQATKTLLTEGQRIAYVGLVKLIMAVMIEELSGIQATKTIKKNLALAVESMKMWSQQMMVRLYMHMEIDSSEQIMIEQLAEHGVKPIDLTPALMQNARVKNPMAGESKSGSAAESVSDKQSLASPRVDSERRRSDTSASSRPEEVAEASSPPPYKEREDQEMPEVRSPSQLGTSKNIDIDLRWTILCDLFLVLIADSIYDSRSRRLLERVGESLEVSWLDICRFEKRVTDSLEMQEAANKETWDEAEHMEDRRKQALKRRYMVMGLATVGGSLVIGLSAGLLAPVIGAGLAAGFTTIGVAGTSGFLAGAGGTALITSGAVLTGGTIAVRASNRRTGAVRTFEYRPLHNNKRVNLIVTVSGWMNGKVDDVRLPYSTVDPIMGDMYSVLWEPEMLQSMGQTINILATEALTQGLQQVLGSTILVALMASLQLPIVLSKLSYLIDNPWTVSMGRANAAGLILADSLIDRNLGVRPITLVGFSLGARVIFSCLRELANRGAYGLIQNVFLFGSPIVNSKDEYLRARTVVSGRFVNGYASNDWILGYLFRATSGGVMRVAGLAPVNDVFGLENIDVTKLVNGHMAYRAAMPRLLREVGFEVESDEFTEIEDPDPENHEKRQRELIRELDEARKEAEAKPEKKRFGFFKKGKLAEKKGWETYDDSLRKGDDWGTSNADSGGNVLFDIEAIKAELHSEQIEVKQLESTLPPMKLNVDDQALDSPYSNLRHTKSYDSQRASKPKCLDLNGTKSPLNNGYKENPFDKGYDEYNLSAEAIDYPPSAAHSKISFDSSVRSPSPRRLSHLPMGSPRLPSPAKEAEEPQNPQRPPLRSSMTMPSPPSNVGLEHNAWADEDDPDFGKEQDVKLTF